jgi:hypothetical protein
MAHLRNGTYNETACGSISTMETLTPPTTTNWFAMRSVPNFTNAMSACCAPVATFGLGVSNEPNDCYVYCNITAPATIDSVQDCVKRQIGDFNRSYGWMTSPKDKSDKEGAAGMIDARKGGMIGYLVLGFGFVGAVWGLL